VSKLGGYRSFPADDIMDTHGGYIDIFRKAILQQYRRISWSQTVLPFQATPLIPENGAKPEVLSLDSRKQLR